MSVSASAAISVGSRVASTTTVQVRTTPAGISVGTQPNGIGGTVIGGPTDAVLATINYTWWHVNFDTGLDGWVTGTYLVEVSSTPSAPSSLAAVSGSGLVSLAWNDNSSNETGFRIERKIGSGGSWGEINTTGANAGSYSDFSVTGSTQYFYRVRAYNGSGNSGYSNEANATTPTPVTLPQAPGAMGSNNLGTNQVSVYWSDNSNNESGFRLERKTGLGGSWSEIIVTAANATSVLDSGLSPGSTYFYRVRAYNASGSSSYTSELQVTTLNPSPPTAPSGLTATVSGTSASLIWNDLSLTETGFRVERKTGSGGSWVEINTTAANTVTYLDSALSGGSTYYYRVRAYNTAGNSAYTNEASAAPTGSVPASPTSLSAIGNASSIGLSWTDNANNEQGFYIERKIGAGGSFSYYDFVGANATSYTDSSVSVGTNYYYQVYAYNAGLFSAYSNVASASPAGNLLPAPTLGAPANASTGQSSTPAFTWSSVSGATSYRIMVATSAADLPTDPAASTGGGSVVINATPSGTSYTPTAPLNAGTTYYWEVHGRSSTYYGTWSSKGSFTTAAGVTAPTAQTLAASTITSSTAQMNGTVNPNGSSTSAYFEYGPTTSYGSASSSADCGSGSASVGVQFVRIGLAANTTVHYRVVATNSGGTRRGNDFTFTTTTTASALSITSTAFTPASATVGIAYSAAAATTATGGQAPYSWSATGMPSGMSINSSTGGVFGTPTVAGTFNINVTVVDSSSPPKSVAKTLTLTVSTASTIVISSVSPNPVTGSVLHQAFTINGSNFNANSKVNLRNITTGISYFDRTISSRSSVQLVINPLFGLAAHTWSVEVVNGADSSGQFQFQVGSPSVVVSVYDPGAGTSWTAGETKTLKWSVTGNAINQIAYFIPEFALNGTNYASLAPVNSSSARAVPWTIPSGVTSTQARVRITAYNAAGAVLHTAPSGAFSIIAPASTKPTARIVANSDAFSGESSLFKGDQSTPSESTATITSYQWTFGDGGTSTLANPTHTFTVSTGSKQFTLTLRVTDSLGKTDTATGYVTVGARTQGSNVLQAMSPDPVNLATGNYTYDHSDMKLPGIGLTFEFKRFYNSRDSRFVGPPLGFGWTHSYNEHVIENVDGSVAVLRGDGNLESFTKGTGSTFIAEPGIHDSLTKTTGGLYVLTSKDQTLREFDSSRRLAVIRDRNNNTVQILYAVDGTIEKFVDSAGRNITVTSDGAGRITSLTDPLGRSVSFAYDASGNLVSSTDRRGGVTQFTYDGNHQVLTVRDPRGNVFVTNVYDALKRIVTAQQDALSGETKFEYDFVTRVTTMTDTLGKKSYHRHDDRLRVISVTDVLGKTESFEYDANNNKTKVTDKRGAVTTYTYDKKGNVISKTDAFGKKTTVQYDALNRPTLRTDGAAATTRFAYDTRGNLVTTTNPLGYITRAQYDARGLAVRLTDPLLRVTQQEFDMSGNLVLVTDALLNETRYAYDAAGRRTAMIAANMARTSYEYDAEDHLTKTIDPLLHSIVSVFDANGNRTETTDNRGNKTKFTFDIKDRLTQVEDALGNKTRHAYDAMDRKTSTTDARGNTTLFIYDAAGNLIKTKDARNNETWFTYDANGNSVSVTNALGQTSWNEYDALNRVVRAGDPLGNVTRTEYDAVGRRTRAIDALGRNTVFKYDRGGRLLSVTDPAGGSVRFSYDKAGNRLTQTDQRGNTTRYTVDALNRVVQMQEAMGAKTSYVYDAVGNRVSKTDAKAQVTQFFYGLNRTLDRVLYADAKEVTFTYDAAQNRTGMTDSLGSSSWQYDALNRVTIHTDPFGQQLRYGYDAMGNRTSLVYPGSKTVTYAYDELGRMTEVKDWAARASSYAYDPMGRLVSAANPNGTAAALTYDQAGRVIELAHTGPADFAIAHYSIALDPVGNHQQVQQDEPLQALPPVEDTVYSYDKDNRLIKAGAVTFGYDTNGNTTQRAGDTFGYDATDRLATANVGGLSRTFDYDGLGNRLVRTTASGTTRFVVDLNSGLSRILCETDTSGTPTAYYIYGVNLVSRIAADGSVRYYHGDVRGSTVALTNDAGAITDKYAYDEFGTVLAQEGATENPFRYLGRAGIYDEGNDMLYVRARYYTPSLGRFFSKDPFPSSDENGQTLHRYVYALNSPIRMVDVNGYSPNELSGSATSDIQPSDRIIQLLRDSVGLGSYGNQALYADESYRSMLDAAYLWAKANKQLSSGTFDVLAGAITKDLGGGASGVFKLAGTTFEMAGASPETLRAFEGASKVASMASPQNLLGSAGNLFEALAFVAEGIEQKSASKSLSNAGALFKLGGGLTDITKIASDINTLGGVSFTGQLTLGTALADKKLPDLIIQAQSVISSTFDFFGF